MASARVLAVKFSSDERRGRFIRPPPVPEHVHIVWTNCVDCWRCRSGDGQVSESTDVWTQVTLSLRSQLAESVWFSTFQDVAPLESDSDTLRLLAPSAYVRDRILTRYLPLVTAALEDANEGHRSVEIDVEAGEAVVEALSLEPIDDSISDAEAVARADRWNRPRATTLSFERSARSSRMNATRAWTTQRPAQPGTGMASCLAQVIPRRPSQVRRSALLCPEGFRGSHRPRTDARRGSRPAGAELPTSAAPGHRRTPKPTHFCPSRSSTAQATKPATPSV